MEMMKSHERDVYDGGGESGFLMLTFSFNRIKCDEINQKLELFNQQENHKSICTDYKKFWCYGDGCGGKMVSVYRSTLQNV